MDSLRDTTLYFLSAAENATNRLFTPVESYVSPLLQFNFSSSQVSFAPTFLLLGILGLCFTSCLRATIWYVKTKARLDSAKAQSPDDILADRELRALRRALLMIDVTKYVPKLIKTVDHWRARKKIKKASKQERGDGMVGLHSGTNTLQPSTSSFTSSRSSLRYKSEAERALNETINAQRVTSSEDQPYINVLNILRKHPLFKYVDPTLLLRLAQTKTEIKLKRGEVLFQCGTEVKTPSLYIVKSGTIRAYVQDQLALMEKH